MTTNDLQIGKWTRTPATVSWNGPKWLSWAFRLAERRGWLAIKQPVNNLDFVRVDGLDLLERLHLSACNMRTIFERNAEALYVGPEMMPEVEKVIQTRILDFRVSGWMMRDGETRLCGIRVVLIPWMKGCLLVPKID